VTAPLRMSFDVDCPADGEWREQNQAGWLALLPHFQAVIAATTENRRQ
jgi:hypothetical protein